MATFNPDRDLGAYQPKASPLGDQLRATKQMSLATSYLPDITTTIRESATDPKAKLIHVELGDGHQ